MAIERETFTFILLNGNEIYIEFDADIVEDLWEDMESAFTRQGLWWYGNFGNVQATYKGHSLDFIDTAKVIGIRN